VRRAVEVALAAGITEVVVSSDDEAILAEGRACGATVDVREARLAADETPTLEVLRDHLDRHPDVDAVVLLQPTSPLRTAEDVRACLDALDRADRVVTVTPDEHPPNWTFRLTAGGGLDPLLGWDAVASRRQDAEPTYRLNGAVYAVRAEVVRRGDGLLAPDAAVVVMPAERSVDVDDALDLELARLLAARATEPEPRA
jgi:CMP-N,N'-diacetyllegionaminic acid synthase